jgi:hypothetical protein
MGNKQSKMFDKACKKIGIESGVTYSVWNVDYTQQNQYGTLAFPQMSIRYDVGAEKFNEPTIPGLFTYDVFLDRSKVVVGSVLVPNPSSSTNPVMTVAYFNPMKACVCLMTDFIGSITEDLNTVRYTNVRWQWAGPSFPGVGLNTYIAETVGMPTRKAILYKRLNIGAPYTIRKGMRLVESAISPDLPNIWLITDVIQYNIFTVLTVKEGE